jgi:hypothetical protein
MYRDHPDSHFRGSDEIDGKSDGKNAARRTNFRMGQWLAGAVDDRVGVGMVESLRYINRIRIAVDHLSSIINGEPNYR